MAHCWEAAGRRAGGGGFEGSDVDEARGGKEIVTGCLVAYKRGSKRGCVLSNNYSGS